MAFPFALQGWSAVGRELERNLRKGTLSKRLLLSGAALIISHVTLYDAMMGVIGLYAMMGVIGIYIFSRGMLSLSYWLYNSGDREKYFFREGWF